MNVEQESAVHTVELRPEDLASEIRGRAGSLQDLFPEFQKSDRLGVIVTGSIATLGASLLIQAFATTYYEFRRAKGGFAPHYPEIYAFHLGGRYGDLRMLDFVPDRKEVFVGNATAALEAINQCGITRIAIPDGDSSGTDFEWFEVGAAKGRVVSSYLYAPEGHVADSNIVLRGRGQQVLDNLHCIFDVQHTLDVHGPREEDPVGWGTTLQARAGEVLELQADRARARWDASVTNGTVIESYRILPNAADFLDYL